MRRASKVDTNQGEIVRALRAVGCSVLSLAPLGKGAPDLLVGRNRSTWLLELKTGRAKVNDAQAFFRESWKGCSVHVVRTADEALAAIGVGP